MMKGIIFSAALLLGMAPAAAAPVYTFPIQGCFSTYAHSHHNYPATDILTKFGCKFVAPTSGVIDEVNRKDRYSWKSNSGADRGGIMLSMIGDDGVRYYGSHLSYIPANIVHGIRVNAGDLLAKVGNSGDAKGTIPHLHFGVSWPTPVNIWWVRRGELYPWPYLDAWKSGKDLSPATAVLKLEKKVGTVPKQVGY